MRLVCQGVEAMPQEGFEPGSYGPDAYAHMLGNVFGSPAGGTEPNYLDAVTRARLGLRIVNSPPQLTPSGIIQYYMVHRWVHLRTQTTARRTESATLSQQHA